MLLRVHALMLVLQERHLLRATIRSIYEHVDTISVATSINRDLRGRMVEPDAGIYDLISRRYDPDRKIRVIVEDETSQARTYNRIIDGEMIGAQRPVRLHTEDDVTRGAAPDYFMIVDADEVWEAGALESAFGYLARHRPAYAQVPAAHYFHSWNYRVPGFEWFTVFVRADRRLHHMRNPNLTRWWMKALWSLRVPPRFVLRTAGVVRLQPEVAHFHHGSWVGPRTRAEQKVAWSAHAHNFPEDWLERVWDEFGSDSTNLHPGNPQAFPSVEYVRTAALPEAIRQSEWPPGYLHDR